MDFGNLSVEWRGHASVCVSDGGFCVAFDPFSGVDTDFVSDIVLVTHGDEGHFDEDALEKVSKDETVFVLPESVDNPGFKDVEFVDEGDILDIYGVEIEVFPGFNDEHPRGEGLGYRVVMDDTCFFVAGDTGLLDEFFDLEGRVDVAFLPVDGRFTMSVDEAVKSAVRIKPGLVVPYHFGDPFFPGTEKNALELKARLEDRNIECKIMDSD